MNKSTKYVKIVTVLLIALMLISTVTTVFAGGAPDPSKYTGDTSNTNAIENIGQRILGIVQVVGSIAAVIILVVLGIKYMMGSAEEKAEYKKTMIPYLIGAILIFAASNLASMIWSWAHTISAGAAANTSHMTP
ncbi:MAG: pilin [Firmicutes bacterium]|nr:pilin [Bacillota bacterium]